MSYPPPPQMPPAPSSPPAGRPGTVTFAAVLQVASVVLALVASAVSYIGAKNLYDSMSKLPGGNSGITKISQSFGIIVQLIIALALVALAIGNLRGSNVTRIITWVVAGLYLCCSGVGLISLASLTSTLAQLKQVGGGDIQLPSWYMPASIVTSVLQLLMQIGIIILLLLPASNAFFKKAPAAEPPVPGYGGGGYGGYQG